jgi:Fe-S-cluster-containing dehydrogenase component/CRP-like cAMP-binding protein
MTAAVTRTFPDVVWDAAILRGLDARARAEIEAAGAVRAFRAGELLYRAGDPADALFVVARGEVAIAGVKRGDAEAGVIRRAKRGEVFGEEATVVAFATRPVEARAEGPVEVAEVPLVILRRALARLESADVAQRVERALRRAATLDLLRTTSFTRALDARDLDILLDAATHENVARGAHVFREGERATHAYLVADGMLQAQTDDDGKPRVEAYLARGDLFGDVELEDHEPRTVSVVAAGPSWLVAIPRDVFVLVARRNAPALEAARRVRSEARAPIPSGNTTAHVFKDVYRMRVARSLLVIDQDNCIRCGHCASSCANAHDDGISRLVRRGDKVVVDDGVTRALLVPNSCQHCKNPSCMIGCPTGAIGRDARGEVFIREDLCTGCGNCAKACPWDNISMAARKDDKSPFPDVAVKCDLCKGRDGGPACVSACPTSAIARIDPNEAIGEMRALAGVAATAGAVLPRRAAAWPWIAGAALAAIGVSQLRTGRVTSGIAAGVLVLLVVLYAGMKRGGGPVARLVAKQGLARPLYIGHMALGLFACGATIAHAGLSWPGTAGGALFFAIAFAALTGALGAALSTFLPPRLSRLERKTALPEELRIRAKEIEPKVFAALSGKDEVTKTLYARVLRPYRASRLGPLWLALTGRSLRKEEERLRARFRELVAGAKNEKEHLAKLDELLRLSVEERSLHAHRLLTAILRGWIVPHLAATSVAVVLLALHVLAVTRGP